MTIPDPVAKRRFFTIGLLRLAGVMMLALSVLIVNDKVTFLPQSAGFAGIVLGILLMLLVPQILYARWRTPPDA